MTYSKITAARTLNIKLLRSGLFLSQARLTLQPVSPSPARLNPGLSLCDGHRHLSLQNTQSESQRQPLSICTACLVLSLTLTLMTLQYFFFFSWSPAERNRADCTQIQSQMSHHAMH